METMIFLRFIFTFYFGLPGHESSALWRGNESEPSLYLRETCANLLITVLTNLNMGHINRQPTSRGKENRNDDTEGD